jgi:hypothetical protein
MTNLGYIVAKMEIIGRKLYALEDLVSDIKGDLKELDYLRTMYEKSIEKLDSE